MPELRRVMTRPSLRMALGVLCCLLVAVAGVVQVAHTHLPGHAAQADCAFCYTAHLGVRFSVTYSLPALVLFVSPLVAAPKTARRKRYSMFSLFTRPPPVEAAFA
jgi:hypothetical protein